MNYVLNNETELEGEAAAVAFTIHRTGAPAYMGERFNIAPFKTDLRRLYVAMGGKRGHDGYEPSATEYRELWNGTFGERGGEYLCRVNGIDPTAERKAPEQKAEAPKADRPVIVNDAPDGDAAAALAKAMAAMMGGPKIDPDAVKAIAVEAVDGRVGEVLSSMGALIAEEVAKSVRKVEITVAQLPKVEVEHAHKALVRVTRYAANRKSVMLVGPAGSGKTTLAEQVAKALQLDFYATGKVSDPFQLTGFIDATGAYRTTSFRKAYEGGGVFLFDEMDGSAPDAIVAFNAPLAGQWGDFPDGMVKRHPDFVAIAAANTFGRGADRQYVGREQLDAATLDRFAVIEVDYDEDLELAIAPDQSWTKYVQKVRAAVAKEKVRHIVSPRASIDGGVMLAAGEPRADVESAFIWKGLETDVKNRVIAAMR